MQERSSWAEKSASESIDNNITEKLLKDFWRERVEKNIKPYKILSFKGFCLHMHKDKTDEIEEAFNAILKHDQKTFVNKLKTILTPEEAVDVDKMNRFGTTHKPETKVDRIPDESINDFKQYLEDKKISAVSAIGNAQSKQFATVASKDADSSALYAMHSVAKLFTGALLLKLVADKILDEKILSMPIEKLLSRSAWGALPISLQQHLNKYQITLQQLMKHEGGLQDILPHYREAIYKNVTNNLPPPKINRVEDFLKYADTDPKPEFVNKTLYSNLGITLVGLAIEEAYKQTFREQPLSFYDILNKFVLTPAGIDKQNFLIDGSLQPERCRFNKEDPTALYLAGGPAGCYWTTVDDLKKFMIWLYEACQQKEFMSLVKTYGEEFYVDKIQVIDHPGHMSCYNSDNENTGASAIVSLDLQTGNTFVSMSDQTTGAAPGLDPVVRHHIFAAPEKELTETVDSSFAERSKP